MRLTIWLQTQVAIDLTTETWSSELCVIILQQLLLPPTKIASIIGAYYYSVVKQELSLLSAEKTDLL
jgi:hypothetical protein